MVLQIRAAKGDEELDRLFTKAQLPSHARLVPDILASLAQDMDLQFFDWIA